MSAKVISAIEITAALVVGYLAYKSFKVVGNGAAAVAEEAKKVITEDLNPASDQNVIYSNLPQTVKNGLQSVMETIFGAIPDTTIAAQKIAPTVAPTQNQTTAESYRLAAKANAITGSIVLAGEGSQSFTPGIPVNFGQLDFKMSDLIKATQ
jgi:sulfite reductase beta subunit-like hemoprotein